MSWLVCNGLRLMLRHEECVLISPSAFLANKVQVPLISPATRNGDRWFTQIQLHETTAVSHPFDNRAAFICVTRNVIVKLIYQQPNALWLETELELGSLVSYGDIITHAAFGDSSSRSHNLSLYHEPTQLTPVDHLLLVTYDISKCLRLYRIGINWHAVGGDAQQPPSVNPQLSLKHVQILDRCIPQSHDRPFSDSTPNLMPTSPAGAELSNIQIRPPMSGSNGSFTVMALYTSAGSDDQLSQGSKFSVIARWELQQSDVTLHESFVNLKPSTEKPATKVSYLHCTPALPVLTLADYSQTAGRYHISKNHPFGNQ